MRAAVVLGVALAGGSLGWAQPEAPPVNFTIAFIGDQGLTPEAQAVLTLIRNEGASAVLHSGDFEYTDTPQAFEDQINAVLGQNFPYFASVGNHDASNFYGPGGYQEFLAARMSRLGIPWRGDLGVQSSFTYRGIFFVLTAPGVFSSDDGDRVYAPFLTSELAADDSLWRISSWHKDMQLMQVGGKSDETGWGVYEQSRRGGAIIATAHEHSYSRTYLLSSCEQQVVASTDSTLVLARDDPSTLADEGRSFAFVSGLGGRSIRSQMLTGPWWASIYASDQGANYGALFGVFNYQGDPSLAHFYFKDITGRIADEFFVRSASATTSTTSTSTTSTVTTSSAVTSTSTSATSTSTSTRSSTTTSSTAATSSTTRSTSTTTSTSSSTTSTLRCETPRCVLDAAFDSPTCAGRLPLGLRRMIDRADGLIDQAARSRPRRARALLGSARRVLGVVGERALEAASGKSPGISTDCARTLKSATDAVSRELRR
jgi:hypothetical protein